jgi:hypothetical protein
VGEGAKRVTTWDMRINLWETISGLGLGQL